MTPIQKLWHEHLATSFPVSCYDGDRAGFDLVELDAAIAGCVQSVAEGKALTAAQRDLMIRCRGILATVLPTLCGDELTYFARLDAMAALALQRA